jgi:hypothetical protein
VARQGLKGRLRKLAEASLSEDDPKVSIFDGRDAAHCGAAYLAWTRQHRNNGYVVNCPRAGNAALKLHRASCHHITDGSAAGFVERDYIKACSTDRRLLEDWAKARTHGGASSGCYCIRYAGPPLSYRLRTWVAKRLS